MPEMTPSMFKINSIYIYIYIYMWFYFIGDMYTPENDESEPDWVQTEKKQFSEFRDTNKVKLICPANQAVYVFS